MSYSQRRGGGRRCDREGGHPGDEDGEVEETGGHRGWDYNGEEGIEGKNLI
jgi:hypothetical protein